MTALFSLGNSLYTCPNDWNKKTNLAESYRQLRQTPKCPAESYIEFSSRALLAGRLAETVWSAAQGLQLSGLNQKQEQQLNHLRGNGYLEMGRYEEAIIYLRKSAFAEKSDKDLSQQSHLLLIKAFYAKAGNKVDSNVQYLTNLFKNRYADSKYLPGLISWLQNPT